LTNTAPDSYWYINVIHITLHVKVKQQTTAIVRYTGTSREWIPTVRVLVVLISQWRSMPGCISDCSTQNLTVFIINDLIITSIQLHLTIPATEQLSVINEMLFLWLLCRSLSAQSTSVFQSVRLTAFMHNGMKCSKPFNVSVLP